MLPQRPYAPKQRIRAQAVPDHRDDGSGYMLIWFLLGASALLVLFGLAVLLYFKFTGGH